MKGMPKHLNTKEDYEYIKNNFSKEEWLPIWKSLYNERMNWFIVSKLEAEEDGVTDETHKVVKHEPMGEGKVEYYQYEYKLDPSSDFVKMGFLEDEVLDIITKN